MRTKKQIIKSYLELLNQEKKLNYSEQDINNKVDDEETFNLLEKHLLEELYATEEHKKQTISTERAFMLWCKIVHFQDIKTGRHIYNSFVRKQFYIVEHHKNVCYMAHRGSGKTFFLALYLSFKMFLLDYIDVCYSTNTPAQKRKFFRSFRNLIDINELALEKKDVGGVKRKDVPWGQEEVEYNKSLLEGTTIGTTPRGGQYNIVAVDDILREDRKYTYEYTINYVQGTLKPTTYSKKARYIILGTPQDNDDIFHVLMNDNVDRNNRPIGRVVTGRISASGYYSDIFPAILDEKKKIVLIPEIWDYDSLMREKASIGDIRFNREMMCRCQHFSNSLISSSLFRSCCDEEFRILRKGEQGKKYIIAVDSATSDAPTADFCAMTVWEDDSVKGKFILRHLFHEKGVPITDPELGEHDQTNILYNLWKSFNNALVVIEKNNAGVALLQSFQALCNSKQQSPEIIEHYTHTQTSKNLGKAQDVINYIEDGLKSGKIAFPSNSDDDITMETLDKVKTEHRNFGVKKGKSGEKYEALAGHDDILDSCVCAWKFRGDNPDTVPFALVFD